MGQIILPLYLYNFIKLLRPIIRAEVILDRFGGVDGLVFEGSVFILNILRCHAWVRWGKDKNFPLRRNFSKICQAKPEKNRVCKKAKAARDKPPKLRHYVFSQKEVRIFLKTSTFISTLFQKSFRLKNIGRNLDYSTNLQLDCSSKIARLMD